MAKYLCPGRWQPFHAGHKALIDKLLSEGHEIIIGIRDTSLSLDNPYTIHERIMMIEAIYGDRVQTWIMPDFDIIAYGRKVGWSLRKMHLPEKIEQISGTRLRKSGKHNATS